MTAEVHFPFSFAKISRSGERFWLRDLKLADGVWTGEVDNFLSVAPYRMGQRIGFQDSEVLDVELSQYYTLRTQSGSAIDA